MFSRPLKFWYFVIEGLNSFSTVYYFYYFYFFMQQAFGFGNKANLLLAAANGGVYALSSWIAGKLAERYGYFNALKLGFALMLAALLGGTQTDSPAAHIALMLLVVIGMSFTWPTLEALASGGESRAGLQHMVGIYNVVWAATGALAYFIGGALLQTLGLRSLFLLPAAILLLQLALTLWLERRARSAAVLTLTPESASDPEPHPHSPELAQRFLRMSWLANPFGYIAINTLVAVAPGVAGRFDLSTALAGFYCSIWCFSRLAAFILLWRWTQWHYRFHWLLLSYLALIASFALFLTVPSLIVLVLSQVALGAALGLIYYSSLFYSMDISQTKGEHGGIHESVIGLGNFAGPALGAASLHFLPQYANSGAIAVTLLLFGGLAGLAAIWRAKPAPASAPYPLAAPVSPAAGSRRPPSR